MTNCEEEATTCRSCGGLLEQADPTLCRSQRMCKACQDEAAALAGERNYRDGPLEEE